MNGVNMIIKYNDLDKYFDEIYGELDIPNTYYEKANTSYESFGEWLNRDSSKVKEFEPEVFLQGSFKLGTVIKPLGTDGSYDIDLVCKFNKLGKVLISQEGLKNLMGDEVIEYSVAKGMINSPKDGKRCWTLNYSDEAKFHMDILPCVSDSERFERMLLEFEMNANYKNKAIAIPDKSSQYYSEISEEWEVSNPQGYYSWFTEQSKFVERRKALFAESYNIEIEEIPAYKIKSPLQKSIQILKRHRDVMFENDVEHKPSSIIITTLATHAYENEDNIKDALKQIISNMEKYIEYIDRTFFVKNPVNPLENFAEKWNKNNIKMKNFYKWLKEAKKDFVFFDEKLIFYNDVCIDDLAHQLKLSVDINYAINESKSIQQKNYLNEISHRQKPSWEILNKVAVIIKASKTAKGFSMPKVFNSGDIINKNVNIKFEAKAESIRQFEVYWQITNTGRDAIKNNCLRGDFYDGQIEEGKRVRREVTSYNGSHLVECYLVKNDVCYGKSEPFIVNVSERHTFVW